MGVVFGQQVGRQLSESVQSTLADVKMLPSTQNEYSGGIPEKAKMRALETQYEARTEAELSVPHIFHVPNRFCCRPCWFVSSAVVMRSRKEHIVSLNFP